MAETEASYAKRHGTQLEKVVETWFDFRRRGGRLAGYAPIEDIGRCKNCALLFIIAEKEELFDNKQHAILAHERATGVKKLVSIPGIKHYGIYKEARARAQREALAWFDEHLKARPEVSPQK